MEDKNWFLYVTDHHEGPYTENEIKSLVHKGEVLPTNYVWRSGYTDWAAIKQVPEFSDLQVINKPSTTNAEIKNSSKIDFTLNTKTDSHGPIRFVTKAQFTQENFLASVRAQDSGGATGSSFLSSVNPAGSGPGGADIGDVNPTKSVFCLNSKGIYSGPHSLKTILRLLNDGEAFVQDSIWKEGWTAFVSIRNIPAIMQQLDADIVAGKKTKKKNTASAIMGLQGSAATRSKRSFKSKFFLVFFFLLMNGALYQSFAMGLLDPVLEKTKLKIPKPPPLNFEQIISASQPILHTLSNAIEPIRNAIQPLLNKGASYLPASVQKYVRTAKVPAGLHQNDSDNFREVIFSNSKDGVRITSAVRPDDEVTPTFYIATNFPEKLNLTVVLRAKEESVLGVYHFEKTTELEVTNHIGKTIPFTHEGTKPLPRGEYFLIVYESSQQPAATMELLSHLPKQQAPSSIPKGKIVSAVNTYFLGGKRDTNYNQALKEFQQTFKNRRNIELQELKELQATIESILTESSVKFMGLSKGGTKPTKLNDWKKYTAKYQKMLTQVKDVLTKVNSSKQNYTLPHLYERFQQIQNLTSSLHAAETAYLQGQNTNMEPISETAKALTSSLNDVKDSLTRSSLSQ